MTPLPITETDLRFICEKLNQEHSWLSSLIEQRVAEGDSPALLSRGKLLFHSGPDLLDPAVIELFRFGEWCLRQWKLYPNEENYTVDIQRKQYLQNSPAKCFHATPTENEESIKQHGILLGRDIGNQNNSGYSDSVHFIHVSLSLEDATEWAKLVFPNQQMVCFPIVVSKTGYQLFLDTAAGNETAYVIEGVRIDPSHIEEPIRGPS